MSIGVWKIPSKGFIKKGDTIPKKTIVFGGDWNDDLTNNHIIRMQVYEGNDKIIDIDSTGVLGGITIKSSDTFEIDEVKENDLPVGTFKGDLQVEKYEDFAFDPIEVKTYMNVQYTIIEEYTVR